MEQIRELRATDKLMEGIRGRTTVNGGGSHWAGGSATNSWVSEWYDMKKEKSCRCKLHVRQITSASLTILLYFLKPPKIVSETFKSMQFKKFVILWCWVVFCFKMAILKSVIECSERLKHSDINHSLFGVLASLCFINSFVDSLTCLLYNRIQRGINGRVWLEKFIYCPREKTMYACNLVCEVVGCHLWWFYWSQCVGKLDIQVCYIN